jgi:hypothetical protein
MAVSHGGQVAATYLTLFGHKRSVNNDVLNVPAIGGAGIAYDGLRGDVDIDEVTIVRFLKYDKSRPFTALNENNIEKETDSRIYRLLGALGILPFVTILYNIASFAVSRVRLFR